MTALTLCLIAMLFCTWKAPRWIKELGLLACTLGVLSMMIGFYSILQIIQTTGYSVTFTLLSGGLRVAFNRSDLRPDYLRTVAAAAHRRKPRI